VEDERLRERLAQIQQTQAYEQHIQQQYQRRHDPVMNKSQAGIGTEERHRVEEKIQKRRGPNHSNNASSSDSVAIYVSNLTPDGSANDDLLRELFSSYGEIRKIHFYVDRDTGRRKGDALVIYSLRQDQDRTTLTESVCSQVRGVIGP
jgi:RNA recognition motif-containing protein